MPGLPTSSSPPPPSATDDEWANGPAPAEPGGPVTGERGGAADPDPDLAMAGDIDQTLEEALARELVTVAREVPGPASPLPRRGSLSTTSLPGLLGAAYRAGVSGRLLIEAEGQQQAIDLDCGWPVTATSSDPELGLLAMLVRQGRIAAADRDRVRSEALFSGRRPGAIVVELGYLKSAELLPALRAQQEEILLAALALSDGTFTFDPEVRAEPAQIRVHRHPLALVRTGLERRGDPAALLSAMGGHGARLCLVGGLTAMDVVEQVAVLPGDRRLLALFDGVRPLADVIRRSELPEPSAAALGYALWAGGHLVPVGDAQGKRILRDRQLDRERVLVRAALARVGDYFDLLGVPPTATPAEIARAVTQIERDLQAAADLEGEPGLRDELPGVRLALEEASRILGDERLRARYQSARASVAGKDTAAAGGGATGPAGRGLRRR